MATAFIPSPSESNTQTPVSAPMSIGALAAQSTPYCPDMTTIDTSSTTSHKTDSLWDESSSPFDPTVDYLLQLQIEEIKEFEEREQNRKAAIQFQLDMQTANVFQGDIDLCVSLAQREGQIPAQTNPSMTAAAAAGTPMIAPSQPSSQITPSVTHSPVRIPYSPMLAPGQSTPSSLRPISPPPSSAPPSSPSAPSSLLSSPFSASSPSTSISTVASSSLSAAAAAFVPRAMSTVIPQVSNENNA